MKINIYQVNMGRDYNRVAFRSLDELERLQGTSEIESEIYDKVFEGEVNCANLEDVFRMFNLEHPEGYKGRSLSVSDVVEVIDADRKSTYNFCDTIGFQKVNFDPNLTEELKENTIKVVLCEPGKFAKVSEITNTLEGLQAAVKGDIEAFYPFDEQVCIICNEEGKFNGMSANRAVFGEDREIMDVIFGPFIICDCSGRDFGSLNSEQLERFTKQFHNPERLISINGKILSVPYNPQPEQPNYCR